MVQKPHACHYSTVYQIYAKQKTAIRIAFAYSKDTLFQKEHDIMRNFFLKKFAGISFLPIFAPQKFGKALHDGPFVYRLGRKIFILERGVRFSYGLLS